MVLKIYQFRFKASIINLKSLNKNEEGKLIYGSQHDFVFDIFFAVQMYAKKYLLTLFSIFILCLEIYVLS